MNSVSASSDTILTSAWMPICFSQPATNCTTRWLLAELLRPISRKISGWVPSGIRLMPSLPLA